MIKFSFLYFLFFISFSAVLAQQETSNRPLLSPGFSVDIRFMDPLDYSKVSVISGTTSAIFNYPNEITTTKLKTKLNSQLNYEFITSAYDYEKQVLKADSLQRPFSSRFSSVYNTANALETSEDFLIVFCLRTKPVYERQLANQPLSETFRDAVYRLGRDISSQGFISKFGTHYSTQVTYGGKFISKNAIRRQDFVESPYTENEFKAAVLKSITQQQQNIAITDPYIHLAPAQYYTQGGATTEMWDERWEQSVNSENAEVIDAQFVEITNLLTATNFPDIEDIELKRKSLQEAIETSRLKSVSWQTKMRPAVFFKKYSLQFTQKIGKLIKQRVGTEEQDAKSYIGDLFFGSFNEHGEPMRTTPLIDYNGVDLNTLLTEEEINVNKLLEFTISPEELKNAYVSVWDDTQKLVKGANRTTLFVSGSEEARTYFREALVKPIYKEVTITTIDKDVFKVAYSLELVKTKKNLQSLASGYNYSLDSELIAAAASGDTANLEKLYIKGASRRTDGVVKAIIQNFETADLLNLVFDFGVIPSTDDLDLAFDPDYFAKEKVIALLERGAVPKNNMIYKAVAYQEPEVIHALLRTGAKSVNNDVAFAAKLNNYQVIKALMSLDYEGFVAEENMLAIAVANGDEELTKKFIDYGASANPEILKLALDADSPQILDLVKAVSKNSSQVFEVVAASNDEVLFDYFANQGAVTITDEVLTTAISNNNINILKQALDSGGSVAFALNQALKLNNVDAIRLSLKKGGAADSVFEYAVSNNDFELYKELIEKYKGDNQLALTTAVSLDKLEFARYILAGKERKVELDTSMDLAVNNENIDMLQLLTSEGGNPQTVVEAAVNIGNVEILEYLIGQGVNTTDASLIKSAAAAKNKELVALLLATEQVDINLVLTDLIKLQSPEIIEGALTQDVRVSKENLELAIALDNERIVAQLLEQTEPSVLSERLLSKTIEKDMNVAADFLIERLANPDFAFKAAFQYKNKNALQIALRRGAAVQESDLMEAAKSHFNDAIPVLLKQNLPASITDVEGNTLLHIISYRYDSGDENLLDLLIASGININAKNKIGETPLHWAVKAGMSNEILIKKLIENGALPEAETVLSRSVTDYAETKEVRQLLKRLELR